MRKFCFLLLFVFYSFNFYGQIKVKGKITDAIDKSPLIGVTILEANTSNGTISDYDGNYEIILSDVKNSLNFSYTGYSDQTVFYSGNDVLNIEMQVDEILLNQVVVVGYGTQKKRDVTSSIASIKGKDIENIPTPNVEQALQGKISGVYVSPSSGKPGEGAVIRIRGTGTLNNANPLYVIDGMITYDASLVIPQDVESIEVLKDASAAAIYGSRGANGVIIITTKSGKNKKEGQISLSSYVGQQELTREIPMLNATEFATAYNLLRGQNYYPKPSEFGEGTNYQREIFRKSPMINTQISVAGGGENFNYNLSGNYFNQEGIMKMSDFNRVTGRLNIESKVNKFLNIGSNISYSTTKAQNGPNVVTSAYWMPPVFAPKKEDGNYSDPTFFGLAIGNPIADLEFKSNNYSKTKRLFGNLFAEVELIKNLKFRSNFGFDETSGKSKYFEPKFEVSGSQRNKIDRLSAGINSASNWIWEQTISYTKEFAKKHNFTVLAGYTAEERSGEWLGGSRENFPGTSDELLFLSAGNDTTQMNFGGANDEALISQLFRINYGYDGKYFITASMRRDQSSRFTEENRTGIFPSASVGWNIGREAFIEKLNIFEDLKIRASYGVLGNQASASTYPAAGIINSGLYAIFGSNESLEQGATLLSLTNPNLHWETARQSDIGLDGSLLKGRLSFELDWYNRLTYDIISSVPIPDYIGSQSDPIVNTAEVSNTGFDIGLKFLNAGKINYSLGLNISPVKNSVKKIAQGKNEIFAAFLEGEAASHTIVGLPIGSFYGYKMEGIFQTAEEIENSPNFGVEKPGDVKYSDTDGNGKLDSKDRVYLGSPIPTLTYGANASIGYKNIELAADIFGVSGNKVYNAKETFRFGVYNWEKHVADAWTLDNKSNSEPRVSNGGHNYRVSNRFLQDGAFIRLRNVSLSYSLPANFLNKMKLAQLKIFISGTNLWTKQTFTGYSPEFPNSRSPFEVGFDFGSYPIAKSMQTGIDIKF